MALPTGHNSRGHRLGQNKQRTKVLHVSQPFVEETQILDANTKPQQNSACRFSIKCSGKTSSKRKGDERAGKDWVEELTRPQFYIGQVT